MTILERKLLILKDIEAVEIFIDTDIQKSAYFTQQVAEKFLKYVLMLEHIKYPHTYDIAELLSYLPKNSDYKPLLAFKAVKDILTKWESYTRYYKVNISKSYLQFVIKVVKEEFKHINLIYTDKRLEDYMLGGIRYYLKQVDVYGKAVAYHLNNWKQLEEYKNLSSLDFIGAIQNKLSNDITSLPLNKYALIEPKDNFKYTLKDGTVLYRIIAIKSFSDVKCNQYGGFVESVNNLSQDDECWIYNYAKAYQKSYVNGKAILKDNAVIKGTAVLNGTTIAKGSIVLNDQIYTNCIL